MKIINECAFIKPSHKINKMPEHFSIIFNNKNNKCFIATLFCIPQSTKHTEKVAVKK